MKDLIEKYLRREFKRYPKFVEEVFSQPVTAYVDGQKVDVSNYNLKRSARVDCVVATKSTNIATGEFDRENIVYDDNGLLVVNKPAGLATQPTRHGLADSLYHQLLLYRLHKKGFPANLPYLGLHHRLDRETSGLVLFTSQTQANGLVSDLFQNRRLSKSYFAIVKGELKQKEWTTNANIKRKRSSMKVHVFQTCEQGGEEAISNFTWIQSFADDRHLIRCSPVTGRTHQLRVHLQHEGLEVVGDRLYGCEAKNLPMRLHAQELEFPLNGKKIKLSVSPNWPELD